MQVRSIMLTLAALALVAGCSDDNDVTVPQTTSTVRFVNATGENIDVMSNGTIGAGNGNVAFAGSSTCMTLNAATPGLVFDSTGTTVGLSGFAPTFVPGGNYTVIAYPSATGGVQFATLDNTGFTASSGSAGLRVFNAASGAGNLDVYTMAPGGAFTTPVASSVGFGTGSAFFNVPAGTQDVQFTNAGTQTVALDAGSSAFTAGNNSLLVAAPPTAGGTALRSFIASGC
jgi:hypothetical protein